ncbi:hypothetical protein Vretifemale_10278 [Volvox reticuliferus]|uniref:Pseudouridine synthase RsuA/RluA-like domain-containing protein n=1 Tax=Volvox reticuliferus TaxID=1737510 RepID=A0A8J4CJ52_9CHLO|nr:hypothetical protein Vretifemale_10278 [Volvox reticuliferus]
MLRCFAGPCPCHHRPLAPPRVTAIMQRELAGTSHILYAFPSALPRMALHPTTWSYGDPRIPIIGPNSGRWRHTSSVTTECRTLGQSSSATSPCRTSSSNAGAGSTISVSSSKLHGCRTAAAATAAVVHTAAGVSAAAAVSPSVHPSEAETLLPALSVPTRWRYCRTRRHSCSTSAGSSSGSSSRSRGRSHKTFHPRVLMCAAADSTVASSTVVNDGAGDGGSSSSDSSSSSSAVAGFCGAQPNNASLQDLSSNCIDKEASMSTPNSPPHDTRPDADEIAHRIAASRSRRATRLSYNCPACSISAATPVNISRHMARCCPDLMTPDGAAWAQLASLARGLPSPQHDTVVALLRAAGTREQELRRRVLACVFWSGPLDPLTGLPERLNVEEAAQRLGLPLTRTAAVLQRAMAAVPLASDPAGPPLDVIFEDDHFLAVNKPVGLHTAPIHRFAGP